jgi:hypothetical protein
MNGIPRILGSSPGQAAHFSHPVSFTHASPKYSSIYPDKDNNGIEILNSKISQIIGRYLDAEIFFGRK